MHSRLGACLEARCVHNLTLFEGTVNGIDIIRINNKIYTGRLSPRSSLTRSLVNKFNSLLFSLQTFFSFSFSMGVCCALCVDRGNERTNTWITKQIENETNQYWVSFWIIFNDLFERCLFFSYFLSRMQYAARSFRANHFMLLIHFALIVCIEYGCVTIAHRFDCFRFDVDW